MAWYTLNFSRNARYAKAQTAKKYNYKFKRYYLSLIIRAYHNSVSLRQFDQNRLKRKVIKGLKHRI